MKIEQIRVGMKVCLPVGRGTVRPSYRRIEGRVMEVRPFPAGLHARVSWAPDDPEVPDLWTPVELLESLERDTYLAWPRGEK